MRAGPGDQPYAQCHRNVLSAMGSVQPQAFFPLSRPAAAFSFLTMALILPAEAQFLRAAAGPLQMSFNSAGGHPCKRYLGIEFGDSFFLGLCVLCLSSLGKLMFSF